MSNNSKIQWTQASWNLVTGCAKVSPGCDNCYAITMSNRLQSVAQHDVTNKGARKYLGTVDAVGNRIDWSGKVFIHPEVMAEPMRWKKPRMIFVCSMADLFHHEVPDRFLDECFKVMYAVDQHTYQVLTKRPERAVQYAKSSGLLVPDNVWFGVTAENQKFLDKRLPLLMDIPAKVRWLSIEPMLGTIVLPEYCGVDWVVCGGESGPNARPMHPDWVRSLRDQCQKQGIPFFFKQWGRWVPVGRKQPHPPCDSDLMLATVVASTDRKRVGTEHWWAITDEPSLSVKTLGWRLAYNLEAVGKKAAGRLLDGREWNEYPETGQ